ncbi:hypothetical protein ASF79_15715 [Agreia sp. Leaf335]|nr:hypothetical protein ASF79_15715 [Agreia sp. Leaf335]
MLISEISTGAAEARSHFVDDHEGSDFARPLLNCAIESVVARDDARVRKDRLEENGGGFRCRPQTLANETRIVSALCTQRVGDRDVTVILGRGYINALKFRYAARLHRAERATVIRLCKTNHRLSPSCPASHLEGGFDSLATGRSAQCLVPSSEKLVQSLCDA